MIMGVKLTIPTFQTFEAIFKTLYKSFFHFILQGQPTFHKKRDNDSLSACYISFFSWAHLHWKCWIWIFHGLSTNKWKQGAGLRPPPLFSLLFPGSWSTLRCRPHPFPHPSLPSPETSLCLLLPSSFGPCIQRLWRFPTPHLLLDLDLCWFW